MTTDAQIVANRLNACKSTGPRTGVGKAIACRNSLKHGLMARQDVIRLEDQGEFEVHRAGILEDLAPVGPVESVLAERVVSLSWRLKRAGQMQNESIDALVTGAHRSPLSKHFDSMIPKLAKLPPSESDAAADLKLGCMAVKDFGNARVLDRLLLYERRIEHSLYRSLLEIQRRRLIRQLDRAEGQDDREPSRAAHVSSV